MVAKFSDGWWALRPTVLVFELGNAGLEALHAACGVYGVVSHRDSSNDQDDDQDDQPQDKQQDHQPPDELWSFREDHCHLSEHSSPIVEGRLPTPDRSVFHRGP